MRRVAASFGAIVAASSIACAPRHPPSTPSHTAELLLVESRPPSAPQRRSRVPVETFEPPELPAHVDSLPDLTLTYDYATERNGAVERVERRVSRTADRIHVEWTDGAWWFRANQVDPRRVSGIRIDHARGRLVLYDESELRSAAIADGWSDVLSIGLSPTRLGLSRSAGGSVTFEDVVFEHYLQAENDATATVVLWWSDELHLPYRAVLRHAESTRTVQLVRWKDGVDLARIGDPRAQHPDYVVVDVVDDHRDR